MKYREPDLLKIISYVYMNDPENVYPSQYLQANV